MIRTGSCLCGAVSFSVEGDMRDVIYCHCSQCRKQTGHHYAATNASEAALALEGGNNITWYAASAWAKRGFCRTCGSALFWKQNGSDTISIMAGLFDQPSGLSGGRHIFVADKGDYYEIEDSLPQFSRGS